VASSRLAVSVQSKLGQEAIVKESLQRTYQGFGEVTRLSVGKMTGN